MNEILVTPAWRWHPGYSWTKRGWLYTDYQACAPHWKQTLAANRPCRKYEAWEVRHAVLAVRMSMLLRPFNKQSLIQLPTRTTTRISMQKKQRQKLPIINNNELFPLPFRWVHDMHRVFIITESHWRLFFFFFSFFLFSFLQRIHGVWVNVWLWCQVLSSSSWILA